MEIAFVNNNSIRIKGKQGAILVNPSGKVTGASGIILFKDYAIDKKNIEENTVIINGPGEYELVGIKISGFINGNEIIYSLRVDRIEILLARVKSLEKEHVKIKEHNIVLVLNNEAANPSFVTSLATNVVIFYGERAEENIKFIAKDGYRREIKYSVTFEKLPVEVEEILLA
jgi:hypothetical protein